MAFIDGYLALCSAVSAGAATEVSAGTYARQSISFSAPRNGLTVSTKPFTFGFPGLSGTIGGRAIFDAPVGGNPLLVLPHAAPRPIPAGGPIDAGSDGFLSLVFSGMTALRDGAVFSGSFAAGANAGTCYDENDVLGRGALVQGGDYLPSSIASSVMTCGVALVANRGVLQAASSRPA